MECPNPHNHSLQREAPVLNLSDPPIRSRTKPMAVRAFGPGRVNALDQSITDVVDHLIDSFIEVGEVELMEQFAIPLPMTIIAGMLGIPSSDIPSFKLWSDQMLVYENPGTTAQELAFAKKTLGEANVYLRDKFLAKRAMPADDVMSVLATTSTDPVDGDERPRQLTEDEALSMLQLLLVGGNETTTNAITNGMLLLMQNPEVVANLRNGSADWAPTIEEFLRLESPVRGMWRVAACETQIGGVHVPKRKMIFLSSAANRDPTVFANPDCLDPARKNASTHFAFGGGIHLCVGFRLARKELSIAFRRLFARLENIRLTQGKSDLNRMFVPTALVRGVKTLYVSFDKA